MQKSVRTSMVGLGRWLGVLSVAFVVNVAPGSARAEEIVTMIRYFDANGVAHYVGSMDQVPPEYRASAKSPDSDLRMPPVTSVGNDHYGRQTHEVEYKRYLERRAQQREKSDQEYRDLLQQEAGPRAESAARKGVRDVAGREKFLRDRKSAESTYATQRAKWLTSCERQERIVDHDRAKHWNLYGQRWSDEETAARKERAITASGCRQLKK